MMMMGRRKRGAAAAGKREREKEYRVCVCVGWRDTPIEEKENQSTSLPSPPGVGRRIGWRKIVLSFAPRILIPPFKLNYWSETQTRPIDAVAGFEGGRREK